MKRNLCNEQTKFLKAQLEAGKKKVRHTEIVTSQLKAFSPDVRTYAAVGKMFILTSNEKLVEELQSEAEPIKKNQDNIKTAIEELQTSVSVAESKVRDLIEKKKKEIS